MPSKNFTTGNLRKEEMNKIKFIVWLGQTQFRTFTELINYESRVVNDYIISKLSKTYDFEIEHVPFEDEKQLQKWAKNMKKAIEKNKPTISKAEVIKCLEKEDRLIFPER